MHEFSKNSVFTVVPKICMLQLMELGNIGIPMPSAECMGLYREQGTETETENSSFISFTVN